MLQDVVGTTHFGATVEGPGSFTFELAALGLQASDDGSSVTVSRWLFLHDTLAAVVDAHGATSVDQAWLVTQDGPVWASADGGTTRSQERAGTGPSSQ